METPTKSRNNNFNTTEPYPLSSVPNPAWNPATHTQPRSPQMRDTNEILPPDVFDDINLSKISALNNFSKTSFSVSAAPSRNSTVPQYQSFPPYPENLPISRSVTVSRDSANTQMRTRRSMSFVSPPVEIKPGLMSSVNNGPFRGPIEDQSEFRYLGADYLAESEFRNRYENNEISEGRSRTPLESTAGPIWLAEPQYFRDADRYRNFTYENLRKPNIYDLKYQQAMGRDPLQLRGREEAERIPFTHKERPIPRPDIKLVNEKAKQLASRNQRAWYNPALGFQPNQPRQQPIRPPSKSHISLPDSTNDIFINGARADPALFLKNPESDVRYAEPSYLAEAHDHRKSVNNPPKTPTPPISKRQKLDFQFETPDNLIIHDKFGSPRRIVDVSPKLQKIGVLETQERHQRKDFNESLNGSDKVLSVPELISSISEIKSALRPPSGDHSNAQEKGSSSHTSEKSPEAKNVQISTDILPSRIASEMRSPSIENEGNKSVNSSPSSPNKRDGNSLDDDTISHLQPQNALMNDLLMIPTDSITASSLQPSKETNERRTTVTASIVVDDDGMSRPSSTESLDLDAECSQMNYLENKLEASSKMRLTVVPERILCHRDYMSYLQNNIWTLQRKFAQVFVWCLSRVIRHSPEEHVHQLVNFYLCQLRIRIVIDKTSIPFSFKYLTLSHLKPTASNRANPRYAKILDQLREKVSGLEDEGRKDLDRIEATKITLPIMQTINDIPTDFGTSRCENNAAEIQSRLVKIREELYVVRQKSLKKRQVLDLQRHLTD